MSAPRNNSTAADEGSLPADTVYFRLATYHTATGVRRSVGQIASQGKPCDEGPTVLHERRDDQIVIRLGTPRAVSVLTCYDGYQARLATETIVFLSVSP